MAARREDPAGRGLDKGGAPGDDGKVVEGESGSVGLPPATLPAVDGRGATALAVDGSQERLGG